MSDKNKPNKEQWEQYKEVGGSYIEAICLYAELLKPFIDEIGWEALDISSESGIRIFVEFNSDQ